MPNQDEKLQKKLDKFKNKSIHDRLASKSKDESKNKNNDISNVASKNASKNTSNITSENNINVKSKDVDESQITIPDPPRLAKESKKAVTFYVDKNIHVRFERFVKEQIKEKKLKSARVKSYYAEQALDFFLKSQGF